MWYLAQRANYEVPGLIPAGIDSAGLNALCIAEFRNGESNQLFSSSLSLTTLVLVEPNTHIPGFHLGTMAAFRQTYLFLTQFLQAQILSDLV